MRECEQNMSTDIKSLRQILEFLSKRVRSFEGQDHTAISDLKGLVIGSIRCEDKQIRFTNKK